MSTLETPAADRIGSPSSGSSDSVRDRTGIADQDLQDHLLQGVSRTFALTIPQLPKPLFSVVGNAYLLCRIVDTIEDEISLNSADKRMFCEEFAAVVRGAADAAGFAQRLAPLLSSNTLPSEHELIRCVPRVITITRSFDTPQIDALATCVDTMSRGMADFQDKNLKGGLKDLEEVGRYCYFVAGCVGEMLTRLFCHYSPEIAVQRDRLMTLAPSFGQGLQMTNILKDIWDDHARDVCWLPSDIFDRHGFALAELKPYHRSADFCRALQEVVRAAHGHLRNALDYTLLIPSHETGIRDFCLWALGMAVLTLRKIDANPGFSASREVKISRASVRATVLLTRLTHRSDTALKALFELASAGMGSGSRSLRTIPSQ